MAKPLEQCRSGLRPRRFRPTGTRNLPVPVGHVGPTYGLIMDAALPDPAPTSPDAYRR